jgi:hypothetical protein
MPISDLDELLRSLSPRLNDGVYVFVSVPKGTDLGSLDPIATFREDEGMSMIVEESQVIGKEIEIMFRAAWITLTVSSDLNTVGLTAIVAKALADNGISCNLVAGTHHDHLFVPFELAYVAMTVLIGLESMPRL